MMLRNLEGLTPRAISRLGKLIESDNEAVAMSAVREALDRTLGKAKQSVTVDVTSSGALHLDALRQLAERARIAEARTIDVTPLVSDITVHVMKD
jgi:ribosomal protein S11